VGDLLALMQVTPLLKQVQLTDIYESNYTFHYIYQSPNQPLTKEEIAPYRAQIVAALAARDCPLVGALS
jgi:phenylalanyl-tRNA synthetase beta subunit